MHWFNYIGLIFFCVIMIPNGIYAIRNKDGFQNSFQNKPLELMEQIGRYGCFILMIFNIPYLYFNFWFDNALWVYIGVNSALTLVYLIGWVVCWNKYTIFKAYLLSIVPSAIFLFSGIVLAYIPLIVLSVIFAICHITISLKNAYALEKKQANN